MTALDSAILGPLFSDDEIATLLSDAALVRALVEVEIALARAEARTGVIPTNAAEQIAHAQAEKIDVAVLAKGTVRSGERISPLAPIAASIPASEKNARIDARPRCPRSTAPAAGH